MNILLGDKIRSLRQRDGRTQENLANAIGVTAQAVSRWESNGGYPDIASIPKIANYFHVTIDELFGYDCDRETAIQKILTEADKMIQMGFQWEQYLPKIQAAAEEYPSDARIQLRYAIVLLNLGYARHGERQYQQTVAKTDEGYYSYNLCNTDHTTALTIFERILPDLTESKERETVVKHMVRLYAMRGQFEKAQELVNKQDPITVSREVLLPCTTGSGKQRQEHIGNLILALCGELEKAVVGEVYRNKALRNTDAGIHKLQMVADLYLSILDDGNCGFGHFVLGDLYYHCAVLAADQGLQNEAARYMHASLEQMDAYDKIQSKGEDHHYTAALVAGAKTAASAMFPVRKEENKYAGLPENLSKVLLENDVTV